MLRSPLCSQKESRLAIHPFPAGTSLERARGSRSDGNCVLRTGYTRCTGPPSGPARIGGCCACLAGCRDDVQVVLRGLEAEGCERSSKQVRCCRRGGQGEAQELPGVHDRYRAIALQCEGRLGGGRGRRLRCHKVGTSSSRRGTKHRRHLRKVRTERY